VLADVIIYSLSGKLFVIATPIGNMEDITLRALRVLSEVSLVACEDTRRTRKLLAHHRLRTPEMVSYYEGNEQARTPELLGALESGRDVALVSDSGTPGVSDPGYRLVHAAARQGITVIPIPGPSAAVAGLVISGLPTDRFVFEGFLPRKKGARASRIKELARETRTLVIYESVHRIDRTLAELCEVMGDREAALCRELTKEHEEVLRGTLSAIAGVGFARRGEFVMVIRGCER